MTQVFKQMLPFAGTIAYPTVPFDAKIVHVAYQIGTLIDPGGFVWHYYAH